MIDQRINSCLTFYQRKCPQPIIMERYFLFPQILNAIDIALAEGNCLDCKNGRRDTPSKENDYGFRNRKTATW
jgi:hypothetical protein